MVFYGSSFSYGPQPRGEVDDDECDGVRSHWRPTFHAHVTHLQHHTFQWHTSTSVVGKVFLVLSALAARCAYDDEKSFHWLRTSKSAGDYWRESPERVIFILIPHSGEDYLLPLMEEALKRNGIQVNRHSGYKSEAEEDEFLAALSASPTPSLIVLPAPAPPLSKLPPKTALVSLMIDPATKFKGHYYLRRKENKSLSLCLEEGDDETCILKEGEELSTPIVSTVLYLLHTSIRILG